MEFYERKIAVGMRERKRIDCRLNIKECGESGVFAGYGSVFHIIDSQRDIVLPGAFSQSILGRGQEIKLLWQHDMKEPIGVIEELQEDAQGLYVRGRLLLDVARAREAYTLLKQGVVTGLSIGYSPVRYRIDPDSGVRRLSQIDLWEVSLVTFPANAAAQITVVKQEKRTDPSWKPLQQALGQAAAHIQALIGT